MKIFALRAFWKRPTANDQDCSVPRLLSPFPIPWPGGPRPGREGPRLRTWRPRALPPLARPWW